ncbi:GPO family capsid scaffolding protein [Aeromonas enteropelogenes]
MTTPVKTGWVCIASAGPTVDNQHIEPEWLHQMAESYDPDFYTACLWPEHGRSRPVGHVEALKVDTVQGVLKLFAVLCPTLELMDLNAIGHLQFCSIEPKPNFAGTGKWYLGALGVTDEPASTGLTRLKFSQTRPLIGQSHRWTTANARARQFNALHDKAKALSHDLDRMQKTLDRLTSRDEPSSFRVC